MKQAAILAPNWLGDAVMCLPALRALRQALPAAAVTIYARPAVAPVFELADLDLTVRTLPAAAPRPRPDTAVIFPNSFHSALLALRLRARRRIGYRRDGRGWLLRPAVTPPLPGETPGHESFYYLELLRRAGLIPALPEAAPSLRVPLAPPPASVAAWKGKLATDKTVAMHVGATFGTAKCWAPSRFAALARELAERGAVVVLIGSAGERDLARQVRMEAGGPPGAIRNLAGETSLHELAALLAAVNLLVANDSGPMHLAGAVGTPVVALFGSTNERETYPLTEPGKLRLLKVPGIECSPCKLRECPIDHRCMTRLSVEVVLAAALEYLHV